MTSTGWICPKCGRVYAPFWGQCTVCNENPVQVTPIQIPTPIAIGGPCPVCGQFTWPNTYHLCVTTGGTGSAP